jgi:hypothetical protein
VLHQFVALPGRLLSATKNRLQTANPCYFIVMARPFEIERVPPRPLTVDETADKYGLPRSASNKLKAFVADVISARDSRDHLMVRRDGRTRAAGARGTARRSAGRKSSRKK